MIKHLVFDFGGVFLDLDGVHSGIPLMLAKLFALPLEAAQDLWYANRIPLATGKETPTEFLLRMSRKLTLDLDVPASLKLWEKSNFISRDRIDWDLVASLEKLGRTYHLHLLTDQIRLENGSSAWMAEIDRHFQTILRSYEQGFCKPDPAAFQNLLTKIQATTEPDTVVFIDDSEKNIQAARELGIHSILYRFRDHAPLQKALAQLGITQIIP
jgi:putative hydrolase of the HAD superfamily